MQMWQIFQWRIKTDKDTDNRYNIYLLLAKLEQSDKIIQSRWSWAIGEAVAHVTPYALGDVADDHLSCISDSCKVPQSSGYQSEICECLSK